MSDEGDDLAGLVGRIEARVKAAGEARDTREELVALAGAPDRFSAVQCTMTALQTEMLGLVGLAIVRALGRLELPPMRVYDPASEAEAEAMSRALDAALRFKAGEI